MPNIGMVLRQLGAYPDRLLRIGRAQGQFGCGVTMRRDGARSGEPAGFPNLSSMTDMLIPPTMTSLNRRN
jgi:hypothetical protein